MFKGMAAITFPSSRHKPCASLPILFSSSTLLLLPTSVQLIQNDSWSQDKYLDKQRLDRVQQEEASNMAKKIGLKYLRKLLSVFWDCLLKDKKSWKLLVPWEVGPCCMKTISPPTAHDCYLSITQVHMHSTQPRPYPQGTAAPRPTLKLSSWMSNVFHPEQEMAKLYVDESWKPD